MKKLNLIFSLNLLLILIVSCSKDADTTVIPRIMGAGDCINSKGWSWNNGEASTADDYEDVYFSFKTELSGELTFYYRATSWSSSYTNFSVTINGKNYFYSDSNNGPSSYQYVSLGNIKAGEIVVFTGCRYKVKDIKVEGQKGSSNNPVDPQWDF